MKGKGVVKTTSRANETEFNTLRKTIDTTCNPFIVNTDILRNVIDQEM
jgi:hypothetical protein